MDNLRRQLVCKNKRVSERKICKNDSQMGGEGHKMIARQLMEGKLYTEEAQWERYCHVILSLQLPALDDGLFALGCFRNLEN